MQLYSLPTALTLQYRLAPYGPGLETPTTTLPTNHLLRPVLLRARTGIALALAAESTDSRCRSVERYTEMGRVSIYAGVTAACRARSLGIAIPLVGIEM